ncbi:MULTISPECIES: hypothetical protein [Nostocales]|uniref:Uncharacterized protein n=3 Tax=Nostocales TaxID=1161 RepID=A0A0C1NKZ9_9CYAN
MTDNFDKSNSELSQAAEDLLKRASSQLTFNMRSHSKTKSQAHHLWYGFGTKFGTEGALIATYSDNCCE